MKTSHHVDGPDSFMLSGSDARPAFVANDNVLPANPDKTIGLVLALLHDPAGAPYAALQLLGQSGRRTNSLLLAHDDSDLIALWRGLGRDLGLPLYLYDRQNGLQQATRGLGQTSHARRGGSPLSDRRTRTARRRQPALAPFVSRRHRETQKQDR